MYGLRIQEYDTLHQISRPYDFEQSKYNSVILQQEMIELMEKSNGIGLAANQVGILERFFVMGKKNSSILPEPFILFNPEMFSSTNHKTYHIEGCLSYEGKTKMVKRSNGVKVRYQDASGEVKTVSLKGIAAKVFQHELDHLNGITLFGENTRDRFKANKLHKIVQPQDY